MFKFSLFILLLFTSGIIPIFSKDCSTIVQPNLQKDCYERKYKIADKDLNKTYKRIYSSLNKVKKKEIKENSISWIKYKDYQCDYQKEMSSSKTSGEIAYFSCLLDQTLTRTKFLKSVYNSSLTDKVEGQYWDIYGGTLDIKKKGEAHELKINVVRGPTFHLGEISGIVEFKKEKFTAQLGEEDNDPCFLTIETSVKIIDIKEGKGCNLYHGAKAYFDGKYFKVKD
ncbi:MAG: DUF1311 domain-containing protein [Leptospiraceae bacterium]|nr:DUF1311 domain-containing protein [Leptospiraceae bacterium]